MKNGADSPNIERINRGATLLSHMLKFLERIVDGRISAVV